MCACWRPDRFPVRHFGTYWEGLLAIFHGTCCPALRRDSEGLCAGMELEVRLTVQNDLDS